MGPSPSPWRRDVQNSPPLCLPATWVAFDGSEVSLPNQDFAANALGGKPSRVDPPRQRVPVNVFESSGLAHGDVLVTDTHD